MQNVLRRAGTFVVVVFAVVVFAVVVFVVVVLVAEIFVVVVLVVRAMYKKGGAEGKSKTRAPKDAKSIGPGDDEWFYRRRPRDG